MINSNILINESHSIDKKFGLIKEAISDSFSDYPTHERIFGKTAQFLYLSRDTKFEKYPNFYAYFFTCDSNYNWSIKRLDLPKQSGLVKVMGSGVTKFEENFERYKNSANQNTSRNAFHCFCDTLFNSNEKTIGGAPQLVGIYRKPNTGGKSFGIIANTQRYFIGAKLKSTSFINNIEWRNDEFEICDGFRMVKMKDAARQPDVLRRNKMANP